MEHHLSRSPGNRTPHSRKASNRSHHHRRRPLPYPIRNGNAKARTADTRDNDNSAAAEKGIDPSTPGPTQDQYQQQTKGWVRRIPELRPRRYPKQSRRQAPPNLRVKSSPMVRRAIRPTRQMRVARPGRENSGAGGAGAVAGELAVMGHPGKQATRPARSPQFVNPQQTGQRGVRGQSLVASTTASYGRKACLPSQLLKFTQ